MLLQLGDGAGIGAIVVGVVGAPEDAAIDAHLPEPRQAVRLVRFDRMQPIVKESFTPDDDAIVATHALEMKFFLERSGCEVLRVECTDRYVPKPIDLALNLGPWRYAMFNSLPAARRAR